MVGAIWTALPFAIVAAVLGFIFAICWAIRRYGLFQRKHPILSTKVFNKKFSLALVIKFGIAEIISSI